jgi:serine protease inhibitor
MRTSVLVLTLLMTVPARAADRDAVVKGNTSFALELYQELAKKDGNLFLSPYSISTALGMTYAGARGDTEKEMAKVLHFLEQEKLHAAFAELIKAVNGDEKHRPYQLYTANMLWGQKGEGFLPAFLDVTQKHYGAGLAEVDFARATEEARKTINAWLEEQTKDKIKEPLKRGILTRQTRLVLTNAIYFLGDWERPFNKKRTREGDFTLANGEKVEVTLMGQEQYFRLGASDGVQILELPYQGKRLSMVLLLPEKAGGLSEMEKKLSAGNLTKWLDGLTLSRVMVTMPKFKLASEFSLKPMLSAMGMSRAFSPEADFSGLNGKKDLFISEVVHKAFVEVNEVGTEAAAVTVVGVVEASFCPPPQFTANRPFLFLLRDNSTGSILFLGRNPKS